MGKASTTFAVGLNEHQLFLDDHGLAGLEGLARTLHQPAKKGAVIRPDLALGIRSVQTRSAPVWDPEQGVFQLWDLAAPEELHVQGIRCGGYHESRDGLHWRQPAVGQIDYRGSRANHFVSVVVEGGHRCLGAVTSAGPGQGWRALAYQNAALQPVASEDGKAWTPLDAPAIPSADEFNLTYDAADGRFLATVKIQEPPLGRTVALYTSRDFRHWENQSLIFHADEEDQQRGRAQIEARLANPMLVPPAYHHPEDYFVDVYNMGLFRYEGLYIGMPAMFHSTGAITNYPNTDGFQIVQLACSRDLKQWHRLGDRQAFLGPSPVGAGAYDLTQILPPSSPVMRGDELWFYYTGLKYRSNYRYEGQFPNGRMIPFPGSDPDTGAICLAVLRRDGFISLDTGDRAGRVETQPFVLPGPRLHVNLCAPEGELTVEALDAGGGTAVRSAPLSGDLTDGEVRWAKGDLSESVGRPVALRFTLRNGQFYSYWISD